MIQDLKEVVFEIYNGEKDYVTLITKDNSIVSAFIHLMLNRYDDVKRITISGDRK